MQQSQKSVLKRFEIGLVEIIFGALMVIGIIGYFGSVSADLDWLDHTISFILFTYLFYRLRISSLLFGKDHRGIDALIVGSFFLLFFKDIIGYTVALEGFSVLAFVESLKALFLVHLEAITLLTFHLGICGLVLAGILVSKEQMAHPSLGFALTSGKLRSRIFRILLCFILLLAFYYFVYGTILEWLEFVLDDPVIVVGVILYAHSLAQRKERFHADSFVFRIGEFSETLYTRFVSLFHYRNTLALGVSGLLILHALTDLGVYAYTLSTGGGNFYLEQLGEHDSFGTLWKEDSLLYPNASLPLGVLYFLNALSLILLLAIPVLLWWRMMSHHPLHLGRKALFFLYAAGTVAFLLPAFRILPLGGESIVGVDILSSSLFDNPSWFSALFSSKEVMVGVAALSSILVGLLAYSLGSSEKDQRQLYGLSALFALCFYALYLYYYMGSVLLYFTSAILGAISDSQFIVVVVLAILLALSALFYVGGFLLFLYEIALEFLLRKWSSPAIKQSRTFLPSQPSRRE